MSTSKAYVPPHRRRRQMDSGVGSNNNNNNKHYGNDNPDIPNPSFRRSKNLSESSCTTNSNNNKYVPPSMRLSATRPTSLASYSSAVSTGTSLSFLSKNDKTTTTTTTVKKKAFLVKNAFFGDSFVRLFGLIQHPSLRVTAFKGATAKGIGRLGNENRDTITRFVRNHCNSLERCIFSFGSVDVHLSFYYKKYNQQQQPQQDDDDNNNDDEEEENEEGRREQQQRELDFNEIAEQYVSFVASLQPMLHYCNTQCIIVGVYPSPLDDKDVGQSLVNYGSLSEEQAAMVMQSDDCKLKVRQERVLNFNRALAKECAKYNHMEYVDVLDKMMVHPSAALSFSSSSTTSTSPASSRDATTTTTTTIHHLTDDNNNKNNEEEEEHHWKIREEYRDVSDCNIHVVWESTILLWLDKWPWLEELAPTTLQDDMKASLSKYLATKPWAERTHVSQI